MNTPMWTFPEGLAFVVGTLYPVARGVGYEVSLAGSVLKKGHSFKDLDVVVFPWTTDNHDLGRFTREVQSKLGMRCIRDRVNVQARWRVLGSKDTKHVEIWDFWGKRVDLLFLS